MAAEILRFDTSEEQCIRRSEECAKRGDKVRSLLYAFMPESGSRAAVMRRAAALYECGDFSPALATLMKMRAEGDRGGDMYALIVKILDGMTRYRSAAYFMCEGADAMSLTVSSDGIKSRRVYDRTLFAVRAIYPDIASPGDAAGVLYVLSRSFRGQDESLAGEMLFDERDAGGATVMFKATGVLYPEKLVPPLAHKLIDVCGKVLETDMADAPLHEVLSALTVAYSAVGRHEDARGAGEMLSGLDLPDDDLELVKATAALIGAGMDGDARYYLDELCERYPVGSVLILAAEADMNAGDADSARMRLARCLRSDPGNRMAEYLLRRAKKGCANVEYGLTLPEAETNKLYERIMLAARVYGIGGARDKKTDDAVRYLLTRTDADGAAELADTIAATGVGREAFLEYLLDAEGMPCVKRNILYELLKSGERDVPLYSFGYRTASPSEGALSLAESESVRRAYLYAYSTATVYCNGSIPDAMFRSVAPLLPKFVRRREFVRSCAAALIIAGGCRPQCVGLDKDVIMAGSNEKTMNSILDAFAEASRRGSNE